MALNERKGLLVRLRILLDPKATAKAKKELEKFGDEGGAAAVVKLAKSFAKGFAAAFTAKKLMDFTRFMFQLGTAVEETESKFRVTFGRMANHVAKFIDEWKVLAGTTATVGKD